MNISIFKSIGLPKNKDEKAELAKLSKYNFKVIECNNIKDLYRNVTKYGWSPSVFSDFRKKSNFKYTDFLVLDIDEKLTIADSLKRVEKYNLLCICLPTASHSEQLNKFRLIFPLNQRIYNNETFEHNMEKLYELFPESDRQCITDSARFFFPSKIHDDSFMYEGDLYTVIVPNINSKAISSKKRTNIPVDLKNVLESIYGAERDLVPLCVVKFLKHAHTGLDGEWICTLNAFVFSLAIQGVTLEDIYAIIQNVAPYELDSRDINTIERAYEDGIQDIRSAN